MTIGFGDFDPEDEYDASDPIPTRLFVIGQIIMSLDANMEDTRQKKRRVNVVRLLERLTAEVRDRR